MKLRCSASRLSGAVDIPGSKSHTIRAVAVASLADGQSVIDAPLTSADTLSAVRAYAALGAQIDAADPNQWRVTGTGGRLTVPGEVIDVGNSGTTLRLALGSASLLTSGSATFTGDHQIQRRVLAPLIGALNDLGAKVKSVRGNDCAPVEVAGRLTGGRTSIEAVTSQFLSSLLMACPLAEGKTHIDVPLLNEAPYVGITLDWLRRSGITVHGADDYSAFDVPGGQQYQPFNGRVAADFSSATFFLCAGAIGENDVTSRGLDMADLQGDKAVVEYLQRMGAKVTVDGASIRVRPGELTGCDIDMNATPDALPMMAVLGCFAEGTTRLLNVPQARMKETDRIAVMAGELAKMGADIEELPDGLVIRRSDLHGAEVRGHDDHRVVMSLAVAGSCVAGQTVIDTAEAMNVTFPTFVQCMANLGAELELSE
jgi:3-phosphoshikimate 1-carboxyvinyltransferase